MAVSGLSCPFVEITTFGKIKIFESNIFVFIGFGIGRLQDRVSIVRDI